MPLGQCELGNSSVEISLPDNSRLCQVDKANCDRGERLSPLIYYIECSIGTFISFPLLCIPSFLFENPRGLVYIWLTAQHYVTSVTV